MYQLLPFGKSVLSRNTNKAHNYSTLKLNLAFKYLTIHIVPSCKYQQIPIIYIVYTSYSGKS